MSAIELPVGETSELGNQSVKIVKTALHHQGDRPGQRPAAFVEIGGASEAIFYVGDTLDVGAAKFEVRFIKVASPNARIILQPLG